MDQADRALIQKNIKELSQINVGALKRELIQAGVIDNAFVQRIKSKYTSQDEESQEFFLSLTKRGPNAFGALVQALENSGFISEANVLKQRQVNICGSAVSSTTCENYEVQVNRNENGSNNAFVPSPSSSNSPTSSVSIPSSPLMRLHSQAPRRVSGVEPLSGSSSPVSSSSNPSTSDQLQCALGRCSMEDQLPLRVEVKKAEIYNNGNFDSEYAYPMFSKPRGFALIINNIEFLGDTSAKRDGADKDSQHLQRLLEQLGFKVMIRHNVKKVELLHSENGIIKSFLNQFHQHNVDACIVAIMSHGKNHARIRTSDPEDCRNPLSNYWQFYEDILPRFNNRYCDILTGKPKIFIIQACQGEGIDRGVRTLTDGRNFTVSEDLQPTSCDEYSNFKPPENIPETEDILACFSTVPGFVSNRDVLNGTWYIYTLCKVFSEFAHKTELLALLQKVGREMRELKSETGSKQMSAFHVIGFHHALYFNPGLYADSVGIENEAGNIS